MRIVPGSRLLCAVAGLLLATGAGAAGDAPDTLVAAGQAPRPGTIAIMLHIEGDPVAGLEADVATVRRTALDMIAAMVGATDQPLADRAATEELVHRFRVRSAASLPPAFLSGLRDEVGAETLVAFTLLSGDGRFTATGRSVATGTGRLADIRIAEAPVPAGRWQHALVDVLRDAMPSLRNLTGKGAALLVLPGTGIGLDALAARQATTCLLAEAVRDTSRRVLDPALATGVALADGRDLTRLDRGGRDLLAQTFGVALAVEAEVVSFGRDGSAVAVAAPPEPEDAAAGASEAGDLTMTWRVLDLGTGRVRAADSVLAPGAPHTGWFGLTHTPTLLEQMRKGADQLWPNLQRLLEEPTP